MTRTMAFTLLLLAAGRACAAWQPVDQNAASTTYADSATMTRNGDLSQMWWLVDYSSFQRMVEVGYYSQKTHSEFDCSQRRTRTLTLSLRKEHMGEGEAIYTDDSPHEWEAVDADSVGEKLWRVACGK
jgi:hypothetical protein